MGHSPAFNYLSRRLQSLWAKAGSIQITDAENGFYLVRFTCVVDYMRAISGGPWMIREHYLTVHSWSRHFDHWAMNITRTLMWVRLPKLPIQYIHPEAVTVIFSKIGTHFRVDQAMQLGARGHFARACVVDDISKTLLSQYRLDGCKYYIEYKGLHHIYEECGLYFGGRSRCWCVQSKVVPESLVGSSGEQPHNQVDVDV
ncbi:hypothetical protein LINGRAHAP2_LOCUS14160 [Linum grandiflorum]